jgi:hypothetical protein
MTACRIKRVDLQSYLNISSRFRWQLGLFFYTPFIASDSFCNSLLLQDFLFLPQKLKNLLFQLLKNLKCEFIFQKLSSLFIKTEI